MRAFAQKDPGGNGKRDTIGLPVAALAAAGHAHIDGFFAAYDAFPSGNMWLKRTDTNDVRYGLDSRGMVVALEELKGLALDNTIDQDFPVRSNEQNRTDIYSGRAGLFYGSFWSPLWLIRSLENDPKADWEFTALPHSKGGGARTASASPPAVFRIVNEGFKYPEALFKMTNIAFAKLDGPDAEAKYHTDTDTDTESGFEVFWLSFNWYSLPETSADLEVLARSIVTPSAGETNLKPVYRFYRKKAVAWRNGDMMGWPYWKIYGLDGTTLAVNEGRLSASVWTEKSASLEKYFDEELAKFVTGERSLESYDDFLAEWYKNGGQEVTDQVNAWKRKKDQEPTENGGVASLTEALLFGL
jgi:putative aldouronate transport system substrate-binding protein